MKTVKAIKEDIAIILRELADMRTLCTSESREPCAEEREAANEKLNKVDEFEEMLKLEERTQATLDRTKQSEKEPDRTPIDTKVERKTQEKRDHFASGGEFFQAVMRAGIPGRAVDPRLSTRAATGLGEPCRVMVGFLSIKKLLAEL